MAANWSVATSHLTASTPNWLLLLVKTLWNCGGSQGKWELGGCPSPSPSQEGVHHTPIMPMVLCKWFYRKSASTNSGGSTYGSGIVSSEDSSCSCLIELLPHYALMRPETMELAAMTQLVCVWPHCSECLIRAYTILRGPNICNISCLSRNDIMCLFTIVTLGNIALFHYTHSFLPASPHPHPHTCTYIPHPHILPHSPHTPTSHMPTANSTGGSFLWPEWADSGHRALPGSLQPLGEAHPSSWGAAQDWHQHRQKWVTCSVVRVVTLLVGEKLCRVM